MKQLIQKQAPLGLVPLLLMIIVVETVLLVGGCLYWRLWVRNSNKPANKTINQEQIAAPTPIPEITQSIPNSAELETYRAPGYVGFRLKYPKDYKIGNIIEHFENAENSGVSQDENLLLWQSTIRFQGSDVIISRRHNLNPKTKAPYSTLTEYDAKTASYKKINVNFYSGVDSGEFQNPAGKYERDIYLFRSDYIWLIQEISTGNPPTKYLDVILPTFTLFIYSPNPSGVYKDLSK